MTPCGTAVRAEHESIASSVRDGRVVDQQRGGRGPFGLQSPLLTPDRTVQGTLQRTLYRTSDFPRGRLGVDHTTPNLHTATGWK